MGSTAPSFCTSEEAAAELAGALAAAEEATLPAVLPEAPQPVIIMLTARSAATVIILGFILIVMSPLSMDVFRHCGQESAAGLLTVYTFLPQKKTF